MSTDGHLRDLLTEALRQHGADYVEVRLEQTDSSHLLFRSRELEEVGRNQGLMGCVRAAVAGGWGFVSFQDLHSLKEKVATAVTYARMVGRERTMLAPVPPAQAVVPPRIVKDPRPIPLAEKKRLLDDYNTVLWSVPGVQSSTIAYVDTWRKVVFANSEGSYIQQERIDITLRITAVARNGGDVQQVGISVGSLGDFSIVERLEKEVRAIAQKAVGMLSAPPITPGRYTVLLDPILAGVFIHEAFGHLSEADHVYEDPRLQQIMVLGRRFGSPILNVVDGAAIPGLRGSYAYDDEGVPAQKTYLIREGVLVGRLHSRETAARMGEQPTGNARAVSAAFPPIVRMTNTLIEPGPHRLDDLLADIKDGIYCKNWYGGMTSMEQFTFSAGEAYRIRNGRVEELLRPVMLTGNLFTTLHHIDGIANDLEMNEGGGCGKGGQFPLPVSNGSPHIRIRDVLVVGR
ncbi:MAG: TldD/PmbA family protein [Dehalococcoidia bacterium]|nr:TldD/PmbA family protein [Dehalococcoidia bacterium]MDW8119499.1 TldD/PmbA family protein [Chloroflexota bacterium]